MNLTDENVAVMRKALEHVIAHPEEWNQEHWATTHWTTCGTAYCFAGHVAVTVGGAQTYYFGGNPAVVLAVDAGPDPEPEHVADVARRLLGFDTASATTSKEAEKAADALFHANNSLRRLAELCYLYSGGRVDLLDALPEPTIRDRFGERQQRDAAYALYPVLL